MNENSPYTSSHCNQASAADGRREVENCVMAKFAYIAID